MYSWNISWISWCLDGSREVSCCNLSISLRAVLPVSKQQGAVLSVVSLSPVTFCPLRLMGRLQSWGGEKEDRERERDTEETSGGQLHCTTQQCSAEGGGAGAERKPADLPFSPCFTSQLCLDKPHSTCVITTDSVTFSGHKFRPRLGD